ncbi:MAG TPA: DUF2335 domain-containing protein [Desulfobulbaceae bacterium]|nr:DUF2335 domain-containing protein [Desulfobulbaceae bacterium]
MPMSKKSKKRRRQPPDNTPSQTHSKQNSQQLVLQQHVVSGPIPDPATLQGYEDILTGAAERILTMAEGEAKHRREVEAAALAAQIEADKRKHKEVLRGQLFGMVTTLTAFSLAAFALAKGYPSVAATICGATIIALATVFVTGRKNIGSTKQDS